MCDISLRMKRISLSRASSVSYLKKSLSFQGMKFIRYSLTNLSISCGNYLDVQIPLFIEKHQNIPQMGDGEHMQIVKPLFIPSDLRVAQHSGERRLRIPPTKRELPAYFSCDFLYHCYRSPSARQAQLLQKMSEQEVEP